MDARVGHTGVLSSRESHAIAAFRSAVGKEARDKLIGLTLFGSRARGEGHEDSDADILVLLTVADEALKTKIWDIAYKIFANTDIMISPWFSARINSLTSAAENA